MPGQMGLNSEIIPSPGLTYVNIALDYRATRFSGPNGNVIFRIPKPAPPK